MFGFSRFTQENWGAFSLAGIHFYANNATIIYFDPVSREWYM